MGKGNRQNRLVTLEKELALKKNAARARGAGRPQGRRRGARAFQAHFFNLELFQSFDVNARPLLRATARTEAHSTSRFNKESRKRTCPRHKILSCVRDLQLVDRLRGPCGEHP